ncbi:relaxase/mobilization nuclease domain-containing protein [Acidithiobacillus ferrooxidans]|uniref:TraI/MobA(P) family conjugative relaxase n=1 Tax=Acidithiobacillus ferrooxidans TaxID=920 RepID=UPI001C077BB9|nr:TraI/MobA(P) family conjugative relaxase [Acidithiobacillus ferrooxidans]MBU2856806.1 relaxase/mobilization nuclease domain-containing protein [Acidithiobacillus ferrooxidans]
MLSKVGKSRSSAKSASKKSQFGDLVNYIAREADGKGREVDRGEMGVLNMDADVKDMDQAIELMDAVAEKALKKGKFKGDPVYHLILSWQEGDKPTPKQVKECVQYTLKALGMEECQAVWVIHHDTDNDHVHIAVNRVHPEKGIVMGPPRRDYHVIDKAMRELEIIHGFQRDNGPYVTLDTDSGPRIVRMSRKERAEKGLLKGGDEVGPRTTQAAKAAERSQGAPSFQEWAQGEPANALQNMLNNPDATWQDLHDAVAQYGIAIQTKGTGMVVTTEMESCGGHNGRVLACPISKLDRSFTKMKLEQRLGTFTPPSPLQRGPADGITPLQGGPADGVIPSSSQNPTTTAVRSRTTYEEFLHKAQSGHQPDGPAPHDGVAPGRDAPGRGDSSQRAKRRAERQQTREDLHKRYQTDQQAIKDVRRDTRKALMTRQKTQRDAQRQDHKARKPLFIARKVATGVTRQVATSLWAFEAAREKESLQKQHLKERHLLPRTMVWRDWLEQQAGPEINDESAKAALRGIRYRERRDDNQKKNGIEGEELEDLKPILSKLHHEIDHRRQLIHYRDAQGRDLFTDTGPRIDVHDRSESTVEAALRIAAQKYGAVDITGSAAFREQTARAAARLGIQVRDTDLQKVWRLEREATQLKQPKQPTRGEEMRRPERTNRPTPQQEKTGKER